MSRRLKASTQVSPILRQILIGGPSVSFNFIPYEAIVPEARRLFRSAVFNRMIVFKYPNFASFSPDIVGAVFDPENKLAEFRPIETGLYFPTDLLAPTGGGFAVYVRSKNYIDILREDMGAFGSGGGGEIDGRDLATLNIIDSIPSVDPFLLKTTLESARITADDAYWNLKSEEDEQLRKVIGQRIEKIIRVAIPEDGAAHTEDALTKFVRSIWEPDMKEAAPFVRAFGIDASEAPEIFAAWKGITFYELQLRTIAGDIKGILAWLLSSDCLPVDFHSRKTQQQQLVMLIRNVVQSIEKTMYDLKLILSDYEVCINAFESGDPKPFRDYLKTVRKKYWLMGYCVSALNIVHSLSLYYRSRVQGTRLPFELFTEMLQQFRVALDRNRGMPKAI